MDNAEPNPSSLPSESERQVQERPHQTGRPAPDSFPPRSQPQLDTEPTAEEKRAELEARQTIEQEERTEAHEAQDHPA
jgi:hypothetical protein